MPQKSMVLVGPRAKLGANRGLGFATAKELLLITNFHIIVRCQVTSGPSIEATRSHIETAFRRLDILVHNADIYLLPSEPSASHVGVKILQSTIETNVSGPARVTEALLLRHRPSPVESSPAQIVFVSSSMGSLSHNMNRNSPHSGIHAIEYRMLKTGLMVGIVVIIHSSHSNAPKTIAILSNTQ
ncbi:hypothetical protein BO79DRAFT_287216 [Aspergillus costaricaensis CBS 115574]|uniref:Uncharacterized protein n=1 Tax=Aspergillus costaricaensis CBS 115574 TaxID=1448317 RepID=A0ACD1IFT7_9EURO|nr:hypothetical protein BO79DRAFT_287216 [Aspergillus costaricaensis CBS 115574]RAK89179.1 hypothetical protein BO79DRAFT_287216 [Aspergillus costaricaensis CBS 115574]